MLQVRYLRCVSHLSLLLLKMLSFRLNWLAYQARFARVELSRRAMHALGDSPCHFLAKHHVLRACLPLMAPFRAMLLTP